jgi:hypothetical protein
MLYMKVVVPGRRMGDRLAAQIGPLVVVRAGWHRCNYTLAHEEQHVRQWYLMTALFLPVLAALFWPAAPLAVFAHAILHTCGNTVKAFFEADAMAAEVRHGVPLAHAERDFQVYRFGWPEHRARYVIEQLSRGNPQEIRK